MPTEYNPHHAVSIATKVVWKYLRYVAMPIHRVATFLAYNVYHYSYVMTFAIGKPGRKLI